MIADLALDIAAEDAAEVELGWGSQPGSVEIVIPAEPVPSRIPTIAWALCAALVAHFALMGGVVGAIVGLAELVTR